MSLGSLRRGCANAGDAVLLVLVSLTAVVALGGGFRTSVGATRISITSAERLLVWTLLVFAARHVCVVHPGFFARVRSAFRTRRSAVVSLALVISLGAMEATAARLLDDSPGEPPRVATRRAREALWAELQPSPLANCAFARFGEPHDGGYLLCRNLLGNVRAAYSYGIAGYDGWGCEVSRTLRIRVHEYDCFDSRQPRCDGGDARFHGECIAGRPSVQNGRVFDSLQNQLARNGDGESHVVVKMDIEAAEWEVLWQMPDEVLDRIDQLAIEFHDGNDPRSPMVLRKLKQRFRVANIHFNNAACDDAMDPFPAWAYEVLFVNKRLANLDPIREVLGIFGFRRPDPSAARLDAPNYPELHDCQSPGSGTIRPQRVLLRSLAQ